MDTKKWCSGLEQLGDGQTRCKHGHAGPGMQACKGIRYPHGTSLAPCEREDLPFCENRKCAGGYWCVVCGRYLPADEDVVIVHDDVPHPEDMTFDEEEKPQ